MIRTTTPARKTVGVVPARSLTYRRALQPPHCVAEGVVSQVCAQRKAELREVVTSTSRGLKANANTRGTVEEAQVALETCQVGGVDFGLLEGTWDLIYTTATDVLPILFLGDPPDIAGIRLPSLISIGTISQKFSSPEKGQILNIIKSSVSGLVEEEGITATVTARYEVINAQRLGLTFEEFGVGDIKISPEVESIIAPALLPRGGVNHQILLAFREFAFKVPLGASSPVPTPRMGNYLLTYLDEDMLIGRASNTGGSFIFNRNTTLD